MSYIVYSDISDKNYPELKGLIEEQINARLQELSNIIDEYCNTRFEPTHDNMAIDFTNEFSTLKRPLLSIEQLTLDSIIRTEDKDYFVYPEKSRVIVSNSISSQQFYKAIKVNYIYGYTEIPQLVKEVLIELLRLDAANAKADIAQSTAAGSIKSESWEDYKVEYSTEAKRNISFTTEDILKKLDNYRQEKVEYKPVRQVRAMLL